ncbi:hypothetical protein [Pedosphaera parvula]|uniref:Transmembrane protein n=1 Tax=Pedosphaera parvula (strain Ellin514) TaxID=320771 RepID=B9XJG8_PEDPL|nr:hypothetical protein [Pedosphaera parvula]EEF60029.1 hypothetical protein Cflav_PD3088 [Pedosphaera parvula Ellin514]
MITIVFAIMLLVFGVLMCVFSLVYRIDGPDDFRSILVWDLFVGIPVAIGFWLLRAWNGGALRSGFHAFGVWAVTAAVFIGWHCQQIALRAGLNILLQWLQGLWHSS